MKPSSRERAIRSARTKLNDARLISFLRAANSGACGVRAIELACQALDEGLSLDELFYDGDIYGYSLCIDVEGTDKYTIEFGCQAGPTAGDGGEWSVLFAGDKVASITGGMTYIS